MTSLTDLAHSRRWLQQGAEGSLASSAVPHSLGGLAGLSTVPSLGSLRAAALTQSLRSRTLHSMLVRLLHHIPFSMSGPTPARSDLLFSNDEPGCSMLPCSSDCFCMSVL